MEILRNFLVGNLKPKFKLTKRLNPTPHLILDIGIANNSYKECIFVYPESNYHGVDLFVDFEPHRSGDIFFTKNLETDSLDDLAKGYDLIIINHVMEHLNNGEGVYKNLCERLKINGILYAEFPSIRTAMTPKSRGSYHFHDDKTHKKFYSLEALANIAIQHGCQVVSCGPASTRLKNILSLPRALFSYLSRGNWGANLLHFQGKIDHIMVIKMT
jgi:predicted SAM-dependent methyltransferase